jgi:hypothetical protein
MLAFASEEVVGVGVKAGLSILESSILGAIAILAIAITGWAIFKLSHVQDLRVADQKAINDKMEKLIEKMTTAFSEINNTLGNLVTSDKDSQGVLLGLKGSLDGVIMEAIRRSGGGTYPPGRTR